MNARRSNAKDIYRSLFRAPKNAPQLLGTARRNLTSKDLAGLVGMMAQETNPFRRFISAAPFPKSYEQLGKTTAEGINSNSVVEIRWQSAVISAYSAQINKYVSYRFDIDNHLVKGEYSEATESIAKLKSELGCSLWLLQKEFLLRELQDGLSGNASLLADVSGTAGVYGLMPFLASYLSMRAEKNVSADTYRAKIDKILLALVKSSNNPEFGRYLRILWDPCSESTIEEAGSDILYYDASSPIIDRYNMLLHVCTRLIAEDNESASDIIAVLKELSRTVKDVRLFLLVTSASGEIIDRVDPITGELLNLFNEYTIGNYATTETLALGNR